MAHNPASLLFVSNISRSPASISCIKSIFDMTKAWTSSRGKLAQLGIKKLTLSYTQRTTSIKIKIKSTYFSCNMVGSPPSSIIIFSSSAINTWGFISIAKITTSTTCRHATANIKLKIKQHNLRLRNKTKQKCIENVVH